MAETAHDNCTRCKGQGWYWRTPDGFNPFLAGGFTTARAMYKVTCSCPALTPEGGAGTHSPVQHVELIAKLRTLTSNTGRDHRTGEEFVHGAGSQEVVDALHSALAALQGIPPVQQTAVNEKPFMYGIMEPDGSAYMDEVCVDLSADPLQEMIDDGEMKGYTVVPLYLQPPAPDVAGGEPAAWLHPTAGWAHADYHQVRLHCFNDGPMPVPLYRAAATEADHG